MRDFLRGTFGVFLRIVLLVLGLVFLGLSCGTDSGVGSVLLIVLGVLCFCAMAGISYWLGTIHRHR